jgi:hypothetical protein
VNDNAWSVVFFEIREFHMTHDPIENFTEDPECDLFEALNYPYDSDDPPPIESPLGIWWGIFNRCAEESARYARFLGLL